MLDPHTNAELHHIRSRSLSFGEEYARDNAIDEMANIRGIKRELLDLFQKMRRQLEQGWYGFTRNELAEAEAAAEENFDDLMHLEWKRIRARAFLDEEIPSFDSMRNQDAYAVPRERVAFASGAGACQVRED